MYFTIEIDGKPIVNSEGSIYQFNDYEQADTNYSMCYGNRNENILIVRHGDDYPGNLNPYFIEFLKAHPKGTGGMIHYIRWIQSKHLEFQKIFSKNKPGYKTKFLRWLREGIEAQEKLF